MSNPNNQNFAAAVKQDVGNVLAGMSFGFLRSTPHSVVFRSEAVQIEVYYEPRSYEIGLDVRCNNDTQTRFSMSELLRFWRHPEAEEYRDYAATTDDVMLRGVQRLALLVSELVGLGMHFDAGICSDLRAQQKKIAEERAKEIRSEQIKRKANLAWAEKDYAGVVALLMDVPTPLNEIEQRQLEYARKQVTNN